MQDWIDAIRNQGLCPWYTDQELLMYFEQNKINSTRDALDWARWQENQYKESLREVIV